MISYDLNYEGNNNVKKFQEQKLWILTIIIDFY